MKKGKRLMKKSKT